MVIVSITHARTMEFDREPTCSVSDEVDRRWLIRANILRQVVAVEVHFTVSVRRQIESHCVVLLGDERRVVARQSSTNDRQIE
jgi:hypothetical protein